MDGGRFGNGGGRHFPDRPGTWVGAWREELFRVGPQATRLRLPGDPRGVKSYVFKWVLNGVQGWLTIGRAPAWSADKARKYAAHLREEVDNKRDPRRLRQDELEAPTMATLMDDYLEKHVARKNKPRTYARPRLLPVSSKSNWGPSRSRTAPTQTSRRRSWRPSPQRPSGRTESGQPCR